VASFTEVIPPGKVGSIDAELDTTKLHGDVGRGITVYSDDPVRPSVFVTIHARVNGGVVLVPGDRVALTNRDHGGMKRTFVVRRERNENESIRIDELQASAPWLKVSAQPVTPDSPKIPDTPAAFPGDWIVIVEAAETPYGRHAETLTFSTGLSRQPEVEVTVGADFLPPVTLSEKSLALPSGDSGRQTLLLTVRQDLDPASLRVESRPDALETVLERSGRRGYKLHVAWNSADPASGEIVFHVGDEEFRLPVSPATTAGS
jgi:hypothetical protein